MDTIKIGKRPDLQPFSFPHFQKYISILTISVSKITRERQKQANKCLLLTCFAPFSPLIDWKCATIGDVKGLGDVGWNREIFAVWWAYEKGHPPPFGERQVPSTPIIFRTKNPEKSRLGKIRKNFGKNLRENVSGEEKAPNLVERGQGVLKYERIVWAKIVELFVITRWEFFHFVFVP